MSFMRILSKFPLLYWTNSLFGVFSDLALGITAGFALHTPFRSVKWTTTFGALHFVANLVGVRSEDVRISGRYEHPRNRCRAQTVALTIALPVSIPRTIAITLTRANGRGAIESCQIDSAQEKILQAAPFFCFLICLQSPGQAVAEAHDLAVLGRHL